MSLEQTVQIYKTKKSNKLSDYKGLYELLSCGGPAFIPISDIKFKDKLPSGNSPSLSLSLIHI